MLIASYTSTNNWGAAGWVFSPPYPPPCLSQMQFFDRVAHVSRINLTQLGRLLDGGEMRQEKSHLS